MKVRMSRRVFPCIRPELSERLAHSRFEKLPACRQFARKGGLALRTRFSEQPQVALQRPRDVGLIIPRLTQGSIEQVPELQLLALRHDHS